MPNYKDINRALDQTSLKLHASQVHGLICGILCGNQDKHNAWEELVTGGKETAKTHAILQALYDMSAKQLREFLFEFQLVLPPDTEELTLRAEALTLWCQGFLTGLKLAKIPIIGRKPSDVTEAINDIIEIAKLNYEEVIANEEDETAYMELVEFIRMAVVLIYQELHASKTVSQPPSSSHLH